LQPDGFIKGCCGSRQRKSIVRSQLDRYLADADFNRILEAVSKSPRILSTLITYTYSQNPLVCWRAIDAIGRCAENLVPGRPQILRNYLQRLFWMMSDESGAVAPHAPEVIGEIVRSDTDTFVDCIPLVISFLNMEPEDLPSFLPGILYALGRIGQVSPVLVDNALGGIENSLTTSDSQARAMAILCFSRIGHKRTLLRYPQLEKDAGIVQIYREEKIWETTIARLFQEAIRTSA
jgi:hypothetical protein